MHRHVQLGMRENPASSRRHGSRPIISGSTNQFGNQVQDGTELPSEVLDLAGMGSAGIERVTPSQVATRDRGNPLGTNAVGAPNHTSQRAPHSFEPLIGSTDAARLLGNIHVKTLQRYARHQLIPGYRIGGHWYFRASELDSWLQSRINLSCHPCRLQEK